MEVLAGEHSYSYPSLEWSSHVRAVLSSSIRYEPSRTHETMREGDTHLPSQVSQIKPVNQWGEMSQPGLQIQGDILYFMILYNIQVIIVSVLNNFSVINILYSAYPSRS